jgi:HEPN domain-containing protein
MSQARPTAWWRQARNDLDLAVVASNNGFHAQACFFATQAAAEKALKGAIVVLGLAPPHTHGLPKLVEVLEQQGMDASGLANLPLRALTRMTVTSRYPQEDTAPMDLFETSDSEQAITTATAVLAWVERLDQSA